MTMYEVLSLAINIAILILALLEFLHSKEDKE